MKNRITDALQVLAAIVITVGMVASAEPLPSAPTTKTSTETAVQAISEPQKPVEAPKPVEQPVVAETPAVAPAVAPEPQPIQPAYTPSGNKDTWLAASGIDPSLWGYVDWIVTRESSWDPCAYYPSQHDCSATPVNACGLVMQNPCHKIGGDWRDPVAALQWANGYVQKYGGWAGAVTHWQHYGNY